MPPPRKLPPCTPASLTPLQQAELYDSLAAEARRRADLSTAQDAAEPYITLAQAEAANLAPLHGDAPEEPDRPAHERPWYRLHDEAGAQAIDEVVASVEAAKAAGYFQNLNPPGHGEGGLSAEASAKAEEGSGQAAIALIEATPAVPDSLEPTAKPLSPRTGEPLRAYKKRTPKPPFDPMDRRNYKQ